MNGAPPFFLNGTLPLSNLPDGVYTLTEKEAPPDYKLPENDSKVISFEIRGAELIAINPANENAAIDGGKVLLVKNQKKELPKTKVKFIKTSNSGKDLVLSGAIFDLYRASKEGETAETEISFQNEKISVIKMTGTVESPENGIFYEGDLEYGIYYLTETKAPDGYNKLAEPVKVEIGEKGVSVCNPNQKDTINVTIEPVEDKEQKLSVYEIKIPNSTGYELPHTGGSGTYPFAIGSAVLFSTAAFLLYGYSIRQKRRQKRLRR